MKIKALIGLLAKFDPEQDVWMMCDSNEHTIDFGLFDTVGTLTLEPHSCGECDGDDYDWDE